MQEVTAMNFGLLMIFFGVFLLLGAIGTYQKQQQFASLPQDEQDQLNFGFLNPAMICPHCHQAGTVRTKVGNHNKGIHGGKATAAMLTGGITLLATGLSRHENQTEAHCDHCKNSWVF
jgi:hypothetical protein